jgi:hypothetical protein
MCGMAITLVFFVIKEAILFSVSAAVAAGVKAFNT